ncbi:MAG: hypothetical protein AAGI34_18420, partial [Pseudomonadota bacterium]
ALARVVPAAPLAIERRVLDVERTGLVVTLDNVALVVRTVFLDRDQTHLAEYRHRFPFLYTLPTQ